MAAAPSVALGSGRMMRTHGGNMVLAVLLIAAAWAPPAVAAESDWPQRLQVEWQRQLLRATGAPGGRPTGVSTPSDAAGGCDGVKNGGFGFHTNQESGPWWQVDLGAKADLGRIVIYNRCNTASERAARLHVMLGDDGKSWRTVYRHDGKVFHGLTDKKPLVVSAKGESAQFVRIRLPENTWLHLDEVEVYSADGASRNLALKPTSTCLWYTRTAWRM